LCFCVFDKLAFFCVSRSVFQWCGPSTHPSTHALDPAWPSCSHLLERTLHYLQVSVGLRSADTDWNLSHTTREGLAMLMDKGLSRFTHPHTAESHSHAHTHAPTPARSLAPALTGDAQSSPTRIAHVERFDRRSSRQSAAAQAWWWPWLVVGSGGGGGGWWWPLLRGGQWWWWW
jgi:hypothetical protein